LAEVPSGGSAVVGGPKRWPSPHISVTDRWQTRNEVEDSTMSLPRADEDVQFATHIKPLFRLKDRQSMRLHFDLGSYEDVSAHADHISERLRTGTMPCDGAWPPQRIEAFEHWVRGGKLP
jgi:hypothetical protein